MRLIIYQDHDDVVAMNYEDVAFPPPTNTARPEIFKLQFNSTLIDTFGFELEVI